MLRSLAMILAGGDSPSLSVLTAERTESAVPFAGKFRIIDFTLSNCINSGIFNVGVLTQYRPHSLHAHIGVGRPWDLDRSQGGVRLLHPSPTPEGGGWQRGTADAVRYNIDFIEEQPVDAVVILAGDHIYKMDYRPLVQLHENSGADLTLAVHSVSPHETYRYGIVTVDSNGVISRFQEKPRRSSSSLASMGIYVFRKQYLLDVLVRGQEEIFGRDVIPKLINQTRTMAYPFQGYWADVGTVQAYYEANMALLAETPALDLYDSEWVIHTQSSERPAAQIGADARVDGNLLSDGCQIEGQVIRSIISPGVYVAPGAIVRDSIILNDTSIGPGAVVDRCIIDKSVRVGDGAQLGDGEDNTPNHDSPDRLNTGLTIVGKRASVPAGARVGRNVVIGPRTSDETYGKGKVVESGHTV